ncbi:hypothetical protein K438DRAFT_606180 [Mycena galopus ATCC 62051]|nr:hypothetical protein K438DRAFT_606180 [Mycena galopus ATCC 62051]
MELFPLLTKLGIRFYGYSPLAGSILGGKDLGVATKDGSRFDAGASPFAQYYVDRYTGLVPAIQELRDAGVSLYLGLLSLLPSIRKAKHGLCPPQVAFRWLQHHSKLDPSKSDAILIGANTIERLGQTLEWNQEGPLPEELVKLVDALYAKNKGVLGHYSGNL